MSASGEQSHPHLEQFLAVARQELEPFLQDTGLVIYSSVESLVPNPIAFWGFNPGQDPKVSDTTHWTLRTALDRFPAQEGSLLMQDWPNARAGTRVENGQRIFNRRFGAGKAPYQVGVLYLLKQIKNSARYSLPESLVTNFIFTQTGRAKHAMNLPNIGDIVRRCWKVHEAIFAITKPKVLIVNGDVIDWVRRYELMPITRTGQSIEAGWANWRCRVWNGTTCNGLSIRILQAPHMSYWGLRITEEPCRMAVNWLAQVVSEALEK